MGASMIRAAQCCGDPHEGRMILTRVSWHDSMMWRSMEEPRPENSGCATADPLQFCLSREGHNTLLLV